MAALCGEQLLTLKFTAGQLLCNAMTETRRGIVPCTVPAIGFALVGCPKGHHAINAYCLVHDPDRAPLGCPYCLMRGDETDMRVVRRAEVRAG